MNEALTSSQSKTLIPLRNEIMTSLDSSSPLVTEQRAADALVVDLIVTAKRKPHVPRACRPGFPRSGRYCRDLAFEGDGSADLAALRNAPLQ